MPKKTAIKRSGLNAVQKADLLKRLKTIRGVADGIIKMVEQDAYCVDLLKQISATRASLDRVARILLENHFSHCSSTRVRAGNTDSAVAELVEVLSFHREVV